MKIIFIILGAFLYSQDVNMPKPEPDKVMKTIENINLTEQQRTDIMDELNKNMKNFNSKQNDYLKKIKEKEKIEKEIERLKSKLLDFNKNVTVIIKKHLNDEQMKQFNDIIKKQKEKVTVKETNEVKENNAETKKETTESKVNTSEESPFNIYFP
jgi:vacuolar-type H+-ATPase subunit I/STV1